MLHRKARGEKMTKFKCPYCPAEYELTMARLYWQVCHQTMYSWSSRNVPRFTLAKSSESQRHITEEASTRKPRQAGLYDFIGWQGYR